MTRGWAQRGFSLVEVLVSTAFAVWLGIMLHEFQRTVARSVLAQEQRSQAQQLTRIAVDLMARELRLGGYSDTGVPLLPLRAATPDLVEIQTDLNGDGDTDDANEVVGYRYDAAKQAVMRWTSSGSPQPMVDHVPPGGLLLQYRDGTGAPLTGTLDAAARARVREIEIRLGVEFSMPAPARQQTVLVTHQERVQLRNGGA